MGFFWGSGGIDSVSSHQSYLCGWHLDQIFIKKKLSYLTEELLL